MATDMLSTVFMSIANQQREVGQPYCNPWHTAMQWKWAVNKAQDESANRLLKQLGMQTFIGSWLYPACLRNTAYANYTFPHAGAVLQPASALSADSRVSQGMPIHTPRCVPDRFTHCCDGHSTTGPCRRGRGASPMPESCQRDVIHSVTGNSG